MQMVRSPDHCCSGRTVRRAAAARCAWSWRSASWLASCAALACIIAVRISSPIEPTVPGFEGGTDRVIRKQVCNFSWSADHRVVDGATMARAAEVIRQLIEEPGVMIMQLR